MNAFRKVTVLLLAAVLVLGLAVPGVQAAEDTVELVLNGINDYDAAWEVYDLINQERAKNGVPKLDFHPILTNFAMDRAAEVYVYFSHTRPDGSDLGSMLGSFYAGSGENIALGQQTPEEVVADWMNSDGHRANILDPYFRSVGIGCFYQPDGSLAWVQIFHNEEWSRIAPDTGVSDVTQYITADPANLAGQIVHHSFSNRFCASYLYAGSTVNTEFYLVNQLAPYQNRIVAEDLSYSYSSEDEAVFTVNNRNHTITAVAPGVGQIRAQIEGQDIPLLDPAGFINPSAPVEVMPMPELSYEIGPDGTIYISYSEFHTSLYLFYKGNHDEMWTMGNLDADKVYEHRNPDPTDTYIYIMRYYDPLIDAYVDVGDYLVVQLGFEEPIFPDEPEEPEDPTDPDEVWIPDPEDLPQRDSEPSISEVFERLAELQELYPWGTDWPDYLTYYWHAGTEVDRDWGNDSYPLVLSDLIFGTLPGRRFSPVIVDELRPGDVVVTEFDTMLITDVAPDYVRVTYEYLSSEFPDQLSWDVLIPTAELEDRCLYGYTRYESDAPGAEAITPSIIPEDEVIVRTGDSTVEVFGEYWAVLKWALTDDGTMYLYGTGAPSGSPALANSWDPYKDEIRKLVIGPNIPSIGPGDFKNCENLETVVLGPDVTVIHDEAFYGCDSLKTVEWSPVLTEICKKAFYESGLEELALPDTLEILGEWAFGNCAMLRSVTLPTGIDQMGTNLFTSCTALTEVILPEGLTQLSMSAFSYSGLKTVTIPGSLTEIPDSLFYGADLETLYVSAGVEVIGESAFYLCRDLKELHLPNTLRSVETYAFDFCENVTDVYFYGTEAQFDSMEVGNNNGCLDYWFWWGLINYHFLDPDACRHSNTTVLPAKEPTCTEEGLTEGVVCADCGEILTEQQAIPATGHDYTGIVSEPTCTEGGHTTYTCQRCGSGYVGDYTNPLGHDWDGNVCDRCGAEKSNPFTDVQETDFFYDSVLWAVRNGVTSGTSATTFSPGATCTRAQVVTFLWRAMGQPAPESGANPFSDVSSDAYYYNAVLWAVENGITAGTGGDKFSPDAPCTRAQVVTFLWRAMGKEEGDFGENPFGDVTAGDYFYTPVLWAVENGITAGTAPGVFAPNAPCTRAQVVTFLYRAMG